MKILALDFSTNHRSAATALIENGRATILNEATEETHRGGSPFPLIERALAGHAPAEINALVIGLGPGSYVGIRSAIAVAQGWHLAHGTLACGISSAAAIACEAWLQNLRGNFTVLIDAQRNEFYEQRFDLTDAGAIPATDLRIVPAPPTGNIIGPVTKLPHNRHILPTARALAHLARNADFQSPAALEAIYLRETTFVKAPPPRVIP